MKEIGGYFEFENLISNEFHSDLIALNTARNALVYLIKAKKIKRVFLPFFLCDSVAKACEREGVAVEYYHIDNDFTPIFQRELHNNEYLYIVNYYATLSNEQIVGFKKKYRNIIIDNVQSFFQKPIEHVDTIYCCRKFFGVPDGAYLSTDTKIDEIVETDISKDRMTHVLGRYEGSSSDYYNDFKANDKSFESLPLMYMSRLTHNILGAIDYERAKQVREHNFKYISNSLDNYNRIKVNIPNVPFMYPFYCENGMIIKKHLAEKGIFIPTLWPNVMEFADCRLEQDYTQNILPLPIDQRYGLEDMKYIITSIIGEKL